MTGWMVPIEAVIAIILGLGGAIGVLYNDQRSRGERHREERDTWAQYQRETTDSIIDMQAQGIKALDQNTEALRAMKEALAVDERLAEVQQLVRDIKEAAGKE